LIVEKKSKDDPIFDERKVKITPSIIDYQSIVPTLVAPPSPPMF